MSTSNNNDTLFDFRCGIAAEYIKSITNKNIRAKSIFEPITIKDIEYEKIKIEGGRCYYYDGENKYLMFAYLKKYNSQYKMYQDTPKFHILECQRRKEFINSDYRFSNRMPVDVYCRNRMKWFESQVLEYCSQCRKEVNQGFFKQRIKTWFDVVLDLANNERQPKKSDGYAVNFRQISDAYREKIGWKCENCNIELREIDHSFFLEVHHENRKKNDNRKKNLKALCTLCHASVDNTHEQNYLKNENLEKLKSFISQFRESLLEKNHVNYSHWLNNLNF